MQNKPNAKPISRAARDGAITPERVLEEVARIAFADIRHYVAWGEGGVQVRPSAELTPVEAACIEEVQEPARSGTGVRVKLHDKLAALRLLLQHFGIESPPKTAEPTSPLTDDERKARIHELLELANLH
jgi:phage terminase small subunit